MNKIGFNRRKRIIEENQISQLYTFTLGGKQQKVLVEGKSKSLPVVITLHGGPGFPVPFSVGCRGMYPEFTNHFIMVYWDQLGCGINNYTLNENFSVEDFVCMTVELITEVKKLFPSNKIILFGMSWGSVLALKSLSRMENEISAVVIWGQLLRDIFLNEEVYRELENAGVSEKTMQRMWEIKVEALKAEDIKVLTGYIRKNTEGYFGKKGKKVSMGAILLGLLMSPDYRLKDFMSVVINKTAGDMRLWTEILQMNLTDELCGVKIPYYILQGDTDIVASTSEVKGVVEASHNVNLHCEVVNGSGHIPSREGMDAVLETLLSVS